MISAKKKKARCPTLPRSLRGRQVPAPSLGLERENCCVLRRGREGIQVRPVAGREGAAAGKPGNVSFLRVRRRGLSRRLQELWQAGDGRPVPPVVGFSNLMRLLTGYFTQ